ncbi:hypothetical protein BHE74_00004617 [Ensete ventricosum]|nr:hypothetical protein BHE74_00004617 [Ensete ventricosum]
MGWMTQVASIPEAPPLTKGLTVLHTPDWLFGFPSAISTQRERERGDANGRKKGRERGTVSGTRGKPKH